MDLVYVPGRVNTPNYRVGDEAYTKGCLTTVYIVDELGNYILDELDNYIIAAQYYGPCVGDQPLTEGCLITVYIIDELGNYILDELGNYIIAAQYYGPCVGDGAGSLPYIPGDML